ncbi:MAG: hypothetical protein HC904_11335, partial [Blastochloris sp.]|nr:hypothetical protein [Blastochloris sp.]
ELGNLQSIVARNIRIILEMPEGVRPVEVMGHPEVVFKNNRAELVLHEHYAAQQRGFLIRCEVLKPQGKSQELARVTLRYQDEVAGVSREDSMPAARNGRRMRRVPWPV